MSFRDNQANQLKSSAFRSTPSSSDLKPGRYREEERANLRFLKATEGTPVTEFKDAKEVADWLNDPDED